MGFIPEDTHVPLRQAVLALARARDPALVSDKALEMPPELPERYTELVVLDRKKRAAEVSAAGSAPALAFTANDRRRWEALMGEFAAALDQQETAVNALASHLRETVHLVRQALERGDLKAEVLTDFGNMLPIPRQHWRVDDALETLRSGKIDWWFAEPGASHPVRISGDVGLPRPAFERWAVAPSNPRRQPGGPASATQCGAWVVAQYAAEVERGSKLTDAELRSLNKGLDRPFPDRMLDAAIKRVPAEQRLARGEKKPSPRLERS